MTERKELPILSTLPSNRFHSCVLTSFSMGFNYFNHEVLSSLGKAGVSNICVFVDDSMLQNYFGSVSGFSASAAKRYSITGITRDGAFHPKIMLFFGSNGDGFLIIGSGNLTASGHGINQELWGAFHIDGPNDSKAPLFKAAWEYIQILAQETRGISQKKLEWINLHTPWLADISSMEAHESVNINQDIRAYFLTNKNNSIMQQLNELVTGKVDKCTLISPFFDLKMAVLYELQSLYPEAEMNVILQPNTYSGDFTDKTFKKLQFYNWDKIQPICEKRYLHAKLLHLCTDTGEYLLFGSANMTSSALGTSNIKPINEEICLLFSRAQGDWIHELGLKNMGEIIPQEKLVGVTLDDQDKAITTSTPAYRLLAIDRHGSHLIVFIDKKDIPTDINLILFDSWGDLVDTLSFNKSEYDERNNLFQLEYISESNEALYGQLMSNEGASLSNKQIVNDTSALARTNPDKKLQVVEEMLAKIELTDTDLIEILKYLDPEDLVESEKEIQDAHASKKSTHVNHNDGSGEVLTYDEFTKIAPVYQDKRILNILYGTHSIERILETIHTIFERLKIRDTDLSEQDEESDRDILESSEGRADEDKSNIKPKQIHTVSTFETTQKLICTFFNKYIDILEHQREDLIKYKPNVIDISMFTIVLHLLLDFIEKPIPVIKKNIAEEHEEILIKTNGDYFDEFDYCRIIAEIIGKFTILLINGIDDSNDKYVLQRIEKYKKVAYWHGLCCIARLIPFNDGSTDMSETWKWELGMNLRNYFAPEGADNEICAREEIDHRLELMHFENRIQVQSLCFDTWKSIEKDYSQFQHQSQTVQKSYERNQKIFNALTGFGHIFYKESSKEGTKITIARPGYPESETDTWDFEKEKKIIAEYADIKYFN